MTPDRGGMIAKIHVAKDQLGLSDDDYRAVLGSVTAGRKDSAAQLNLFELEAVLKRLKQLGWEPRRAKPATAKRPDRRQAQRPEARKVRALWLSLHEAGKVDDPSERALNSYVKRMTGSDDLHWVEPDKFPRLIESLKKWLAR